MDIMSILKAPKKLLDLLLGSLFINPYQKVQEFDRWKSSKTWHQKWRGHHPNVDKNGMDVIYEEAMCPSTCSFTFNGLK